MGRAGTETNQAAACGLLSNSLGLYFVYAQFLKLCLQPLLVL